MIIILNEERTEIVDKYGINGTRGRELAERQLKAHPEYSATYVDTLNNTIPLHWYRGNLNDIFIDSPYLPDSARIAPGYRETTIELFNHPMHNKSEGIRK